MDIKQPRFKPPPKVFGPVWTLLYGCVAVSPPDSCFWRY
ncbi:tryptophan-rich sensory protein [Candidatus Bathyarchaeota archaeon]|nr:tryptophan-rich sensory protein [Candidatus Bathyarchaeota archaeon]